MAYDRTIRFYRGNTGTLPTVLDGEPAWGDDTGELYIGGKTGRPVPIGVGIRPEAFGAVGDGVTDDTASINACLAAARATSGEVRFSPKTYIISAPLNCTGARTGLTLSGSGINTTVLLWRGTSGNILDFTHSHQCHIRDLYIKCVDPTSAGYEADCGILFGRNESGNSSGFHYLDNVMVAGLFTKAAIYSVSSEGNVFVNVHAHTSGAATAYGLMHGDENPLSAASSFQTLTPLASNATGQVIVGGEFWNNHASGGAAIYFHQTSRTVMNGAYLYVGGTPTAAMVIEGTVRNLTMNDTHIEGAPSYGVHVTGTLTDSHLHGCLFNGTTAGIYGANSSTVQFSTILGCHNDSGDRFNFNTLVGCTVDASTLKATVRTSSSNNTWLNADMTNAGQMNLTGSVGDVFFSTVGAIGITTGLAAPSTQPANSFQVYSLDNGAGNACPHFRTENGTVIGLNQSLETGDSPSFAGATISGGVLTLSPGSIYGGSAVYLNGGNGAENAIYTVGTGAPVVYFDHRGASNTGIWEWRNGTNATASCMDLSAFGVLNVVGSYKVDGTQVVGARVVDSDIGGTVNASTYDAATAAVIQALKDMAIAHGLISAS